MATLTLHTNFPYHLEKAWNDLLVHNPVQVPFLRHEYQRIWWNHRGGGEWPETKLLLISMEENGDLKGIAPLFFAPSFEGTPSLLNLGSIEVSDYLDLICRQENLDQFCNRLFTYLDQMPSPAWKKLHFFNILNGSPTILAMEKAAQKAGWKFENTCLQHSPVIPLPGNWETYLAGIDKKQRHEIRRKMRRLEESGIPYRWYIVTDRNTLNDEINAFIELMSQDEKKAEFLTSEMVNFLRDAIQCAFDAGCLNLAFLEINDQKAAAYLSFDYLNRLWVYNSGLNRNLNEYSPGWVLLGYLLQWTIANNYQEFDFMRGNEDYKYRFGAVDRFIRHISLERS